MVHDHIDFNKIYMIVISITVYIQECWIPNLSLNLTGIGKRMIDNRAKHQSNIWFGWSCDLY